MPTYISLINFTHQGVTTITDSPKRRAAAKKAAKDLGIKWQGSYLVMGQYDLVLIVEAPDDETMARFALMVATQGNLSTQTMRAFTEAETDNLVKTLA